MGELTPPEILALSPEHSEASRGSSGEASQARPSALQFDEASLPSMFPERSEGHEKSSLSEGHERGSPGDLSPVFMRKLQEDLLREEGTRSKAYLDTEGVLTTGKGINVEEYFRRTGVRLASKVGDEASQEDLDEAERDSLEVSINDARTFLFNFDELDPVRKRAVIKMSYQLGATRLKGFLKFQEAMEKGDFESAADEVMDSKMARTPALKARSQRLADEVRFDGEGVFR